MSTGSSEDQPRRRRRLPDELEEGECAPGGYHSSSDDTEDYYNRDAAFSGESDETISDLDATASSAAVSHDLKGYAASASSAASSHTRKGNHIADAGANGNPTPPAEPVVHQQPAPPHAAAAAGGKQAPLVRRNPEGRQNPDGYTCRDPVCRMWFRTHQALGGHAAAHKSRRIAAAAAAGTHQDGAAPCRGVPKPEKRHECRECSAVFAKGVQLGGHMRKHWKGDPIVPKKKQRLIEPLPPPLADVHVPAMDATAAAAERTPEPAAGPRATGRVLLFGVDIGSGVQTPPAQEGSPATKDSSASTGGEQQ